MQMKRGRPRLPRPEKPTPAPAFTNKELDLTRPKGFKPKPIHPGIGPMFYEILHRKRAEQARAKAELDAQPKDDSGSFRKREIVVTYWDEYVRRLCSTAVRPDLFVRLWQEGRLEHQLTGKSPPETYPSLAEAQASAWEERTSRGNHW